MYVSRKTKIGRRMAMRPMRPAGGRPSPVRPRRMIRRPTRTLIRIWIPFGM